MAQHACAEVSRLPQPRRGYALTQVWEETGSLAARAAASRPTPTAAFASVADGLFVGASPRDERRSGLLLYGGRSMLGERNDLWRFVWDPSGAVTEEV